MGTKPQHELAFMLENDNGYGVRQIIARIVFLTDEGVRFPGDRWSSHPSDLADFQVSAYINRDTVGAGDGRFEFKPFIVELQQAETMVRVLRRVTRGMDKLRAELGYAEGYAEVLARVAKVLGVKRYVLKPHNGGNTFSDGERYRYAETGAMQAWVRMVEADFTKQRQLVAA